MNQEITCHKNLACNYLMTKNKEIDRQTNKHINKKINK